MARLAEVLTGVGVSLVLTMAAIRVRAELLSPGELVLVISYTRMLYKPVRKLTTEGARVAKALASAQRVTEVLDLPVEDRTSGLPVDRIDTDLLFHDVSHTYPDGRRSVHRLSLAIPAGDTTAIVGENGTGKSTILGLLLRLLRPSSGTITAGTMRLEEIQLDSYRRSIAYVPQQLSLFGGTIRENILFGNPDVDGEALDRAIDASYLRPVLDALPNGIDTVLDEDGTSLSGDRPDGSCSLAPHFVTQPILLLDEPLAGLDIDAQVHVCAAIRAVAAGRTTVVVHHGDLGLLRPDHVVSLDPIACTGFESPLRPAVMPVHRPTFEQEAASS